MKRIIITLMLLSTQTSLFSSEFMIEGKIPQYIQQIAVGVTSIIQLDYANDRQDYVNGGLTFTYPVDLFTSIPRVQASIELTGTSVAATAYCVVVSSNSTASTTVTVYKISNSGGAAVEAATNEVKVTILAIQNPD